VDALNQDEAFLALRDGPWLLLVHKLCVESVTELGEETP
jgi:hypothetical protein